MAKKMKSSHRRSNGVLSRSLKQSLKSKVSVIRLRAPKKPVGEPWPLHDLHVYDAPNELKFEVSFGRMLKEVMEERGWKYHTNPCHGIERKLPGKLQVTYYVNEFEASIRGEHPAKLFGKKGAVQDGYHLKKRKLPSHALWMMMRLPYRVPGTCNESVREREDFIRIVVKHGHNLPGSNGNYRIGKFPGTEDLCNKIKLSEAFKNEPWYPTTYIMPRDKSNLLNDIRSRGNSQNNLWIGKPQNDFGGSGIRVWHGSDPELSKTVRDSPVAPRSVIQYYLPDPYLIGGYKFHMRLHLAITCLNPVQAYVQENGVCLFATKPYTLANNTLGDSFDPPVHVTNMGLNSKPENKDNFFRKKPIIGPGQQLRMKALTFYLAKNHPGFSKQLLWQQIINISASFACYIAQHLQSRSKKCTPDRHFELFGMDLMLDKNLKVWMCEVNTDPGLDYPDDEVLGSPNPDYDAEIATCRETWHDLLALLGLDAGRTQKKGSLRHWFEVDCSNAEKP